MELSTQEVDTLSAYWEGTLPPEERGKLEKRLQEEPGFRWAAEQLQALAMTLNAARDQKILEFLRQEDQAQVRAGKFGSRWFWLAAGIGLMIATYFWLRTPPPAAPEQKETSNPILVYLKPYPSPDGTLSAGSKEESAYSTFDQGKYKAAIPLLQQEFNAGDGRDSLLLFYKGIASLYINDPGTAIDIFTGLTGSPTIPQDDNSWFMALAFTQAGNTQAALTVLKTLKNSPARAADAANLEAVILENKK